MVPDVSRRAFLLAGAGIAAAAAGLLTPFGRVAEPADQVVQLGDLALAVGANPWRLSLRGPDGRLVWQEPLDGTLELRTRDGVYRALRLVSTAALGDETTQLIAATDDPDGRRLTVEVQRLGPRVFRLTATASDPAGVVSVGGSLVADPEERFVGLGERFTGVDQRGRVVEVWAADRRVAGYGDSTYAPLPLLMSSQGYAVALERFERSWLDLASTQADRWSWLQMAPAASLLVSYGPGLKQLVQLNVAVTGLPPVPPLWTFGVWKVAVGGQDAVLAEMGRLRALRVPVSAAFVFDAVDDHANIGWPTVNFGGRHTGQYPDLPAFTAALHRLGLKALNYFTADFHLGRASYSEAAGHGFLVKRDNGRAYLHPEFQISWLDFTDPDAVDWWQRLWDRALVALGFDGGMLDLGELIPEDATFADATTGLATHNRYPLLYTQAAWQAAAAARPSGDFALIARSGARGAQRFQSLQWPGDPLMRWQAPDGLQSMVPAALSFGLSGFPYWCAEVAGYVQVGLPADQERELWLRWLQLGTWTATLHDHYGDHPNAPVEAWQDEATMAAFRDAARIHNSLVVYIYSSVTEAHRTGVPLMRFLPLEVPDDPRAWREEGSYFFGPLFLVAPVVEPRATSRTVYLPEGEWVDFWTGQTYRGGQETTVAAPLDGGRAPVFCRAGALVPLAADFDTLAPGDDPSVRGYTGDLVVRIMPGDPGAAAATEFALYDGTLLRWDGGTLRISDNGRPRSVELRLPDGTSLTRRVEGREGAIVGAPGMVRQAHHDGSTGSP